MTPPPSRRDFIRLGAAGVGAAGAVIAASGARPSHAPPTTLGPAPEQLFRAPPIDLVKIAFVGVGGMGSAHVRNFLKIPGVRVTAVCDINPDAVTRIQDWTVEAGQPKPTGYSNGDWDFVRLCENEDADLVFTATPWKWHVPVCVAAMRNGKHAATEVPAAVTVDECWEMVETAEATQRHCVMMENCCYDWKEMLCLNLVRKGLLGEVLHGEAGYCHDLRALKFASGGEALWRTDHSVRRNGNLYPTHGLGPIAQCMDINRGDQFDYLVSMSSPSRGLNDFAAEQFGEHDPRATRTYKLGDVNTALIKTHKGRTIYLVHDTNLARPYSRLNRLQGTGGIFEGYPPRVHVEGVSKPHGWDELDAWKDEHEHPIWTTLRDEAKGAGHGGMDYIEDRRLIDCLRAGEPMDMDVYDAAAWSCVGELTELSVARGSEPVKIPDFTRGRWRTWPSLGIVNVRA